MYKFLSKRAGAGMQSCDLTMPDIAPLTKKQAERVEAGVSCRKAVKPV